MPLTGQNTSLSILELLNTSWTSCKLLLQLTATGRVKAHYLLRYGLPPGQRLGESNLFVTAGTEIIQGVDNQGNITPDPRLTRRQQHDHADLPAC
jgi:hypothetical protein